MSCGLKFGSRSIRIDFLIGIMIAMKKFQSGFDGKKSIKVCLKIFNQGLLIKS
jgi:hypothetical protein